MLKTINIISFIFLLITAFLTLLIYQEDMDVHLQNTNYYFIGLTSILALLLIIKWNIRWQVLFINKNQKGYNIGREGLKNSTVYELITIVFYFFLGGIILYYKLPIWYLGIVIFLFFIEGTLHLIYNRFFLVYKIIITPHALISITNDIKIVRWDKIKRIEKVHNDLQIIDNNNHVTLIDLDLLEPEDAKKLIQEILQIAKNKTIYFGFRN